MFRHARPTRRPGAGTALKVETTGVVLVAALKSAVAEPNKAFWGLYNAKVFAPPVWELAENLCPRHSIATLQKRSSINQDQRQRKFNGQPDTRKPYCKPRKYKKCVVSVSTFYVESVEFDKSKSQFNQEREQTSRAAIQSAQMRTSSSPVAVKSSTCHCGLPLSSSSSIA